MKDNEWTGATILWIIFLVVAMIVGGVARGMGYDSGYDDAKAGKTRYSLPSYNNPYPNTYRGIEDYNQTISDILDNDYLINSSDEIHKGGNEYDNKSGEKYQDFGKQVDEDRSETGINLQTDSDNEQKISRDIPSMGWFFQTILYGVALIH